jgi:hypothetical protein
MSSHASPSAREGVAASPAPPRVGIDLGVRHLLTAAPATTGLEINDALVVDGELERLLFEELRATMRRLEASDTITRTMEAAVFVRYHDRLLERFANAVAQLLNYLETFPRTPVVVLEDLDQPPRSLVECRRGGVDVGTWLLPAFQHRVVQATESCGYRVEFVDRDGTTKECHACEQQDTHIGPSHLVCNNDDCPLDHVCRDQSAAVTIAKRIATNPSQNQ